jgi:hypothetical protein
MAGSPIISLAILKANWDILKKDYLENFVPIVAECIRLSDSDVISLPSLQQSLRSSFGLTLPQHVIENILRRVRRANYIATRNGVYVRNRRALAQLDFLRVQQEVVRKHEVLLKSFIDFCNERFQIHVTQEEAELALQSYLEDTQKFLLGAVNQDVLVHPAKHPDKSTRYLVASFIQHIQSCCSSEFEYLETIVKGNMLANAIFLPDQSQVARKFRFTEVYFDTSFLLFALGYAGAARQEPCVELLHLLYEAKAELRCFTHTLHEAKGVLDANANVLANQRTANGYGPSIEYFLSQGYTSSDIEMFSAQLQNDLQKLKIRVVDKPRYDEHQYVIGEQELAEALNKTGVYRRELPLRRDVDSISAIMRLRRGQESYYFEDCRALFVTTNSRLAYIARDLFYKEAPYGIVSPCITDRTLTNLLWLKQPNKAPDLPRKRIIADYYAAIQPDDVLWRRYIAEISKLRQQQEITEDNYYILRHSLEAKTALMDTTLGEEEAFAQGTVQEILAIVQTRLQQEVHLQYQQMIRDRESTLESVSQQRDSALKEAERLATEATQRESATSERISLQSRRIAKVVSWILTGIALILVFIATLFTFPWQLPEAKNFWLQYLISILLGVLFIMSILNIVFGTRIMDLINKFEITLTQWIEKNLRSLFQ